jgi:SagB-type dehydrogenase family enzyme
LGCELEASSGVDGSAFQLPEDEWPMLSLEVRGAPEFPRGESREWFGGVANRLSAEVIRYPLIEAVHEGTMTGNTPLRSRFGLGEVDQGIGAAVRGGDAFGTVVRRRRSALDFRGGSETISLDQLMTLLHGAAPPECVQLYLYVHRVAGLTPGVYRYWPEDSRLELMKAGDQRVMAAALSLSQDLAGNSCVTISMIGDLAQGYRPVHFEAGAIGQRLYIGAEALGFQSTGIGAFFDDAVHQYLEIAPASARQVVYHFACGYAVQDDRLVDVD